jgi:CheY-like chemotaxis protein/tRNA A-37 threonylcarbamoyl transferase component Bud32
VRVLVVVAEQVTRSIVEMILRGGGHDPVVRDSMTAGLAAIAAGAAGGARFSVVLVDAALPADGALAVCRATLTPDSPWVVALAGSPAEATAALAAGAIEVVRRPVDRKELLGTLQRLGPFLAQDDGAGTATNARDGGRARGCGGDPSLLGQVLEGRYEIRDLIGEGGMGAVYKARHVLVDELVAVKVIRSHLARRPASRARFLREARLNMRLCHPSVIAVRDCGATPDGVLYMALDYSPGVSLRTVIREQGPLPESRVVRVAHQIAEALRAAHQQGVVHRDLKPDNVLLEPGDVVRVCDFGLAKLFDDPADAGITCEGVVVGTPHYMSPEQCEGAELDGRADLYALGCLLFECLSGERLFTGSSATSILDRQLLETPRAPSAAGARVSPRFEGLILRLLAKDPDDRPASAQAFLDALSHLERARPGRGLKILLADDSGSSRTLLAGLLERWGHRVTPATDGDAAVALATTAGARFGAVLLDREMPAMDGVDAALLIRANEGPGRVPIILMTSDHAGEDRDRYAAAGVDVVLTKPFRPEELAAALGKVTARPGAGAGPVELFDLQEALARVEGDRGLLGETLGLLLEDAERLERQLVEAVAAGDRQGAARAAHELRGAAANCSTSVLTLAASRLELVARESGPLEPALARLRRALQRTRPVLRSTIHGESETTPVRRPAA